MEPKGDKPRKIVVCHPDRYRDVQAAVTKLGYGDVLVQSNRHVPEVDKVYILDPVLNDGPGTPQWEQECGEFGCHDDGHAAPGSDSGGSGDG